MFLALLVPLFADVKLDGIENYFFIASLQLTTRNCWYMKKDTCLYIQWWTVAAYNICSLWFRILYNIFSTMSSLSVRHPVYIELKILEFQFCSYGTRYSSAHLSVRRCPHQFSELGLSPLYAASPCTRVKHEAKQATHNISAHYDCFSHVKLREILY